MIKHMLEHANGLHDSLRSINKVHLAAVKINHNIEGFLHFQFDRQLRCEERKNIHVGEGFC